MIIYLCLSSNYVFYLCSTCSTINVTDSKQCYLYFICQVFLTYTCISSGIIFFSFQCKWLCIPLWLSKLCILSLSMISLEIDVSQSVSLKKKKPPHAQQKPSDQTNQPLQFTAAPLRAETKEWSPVAAGSSCTGQPRGVCSGLLWFCPSLLPMGYLLHEALEQRREEKELFGH